nr:hypothetical protein BdHM001_11810 [Bdellovibrio sp. HM001]
MATADLKTSSSNKTNQESLDLAIRKIDLIYQQNVTGIAAIIANASVYVYIAWDNVTHAYLVSWAVILLSTAFIRLGFLHRWNRIKSSLTHIYQTRFWLYAMYVLLGISGLCWGTIGWLAPYGDTAQQILTALLVCSMSAGAMITYVSSRIAMACVVVPAMGMWGLSYLFSDVPYHIPVGGLITVYCFLMVIIGKNLHRALIQLLTLDSKLQKNEEHLRMSMSSSDALSWDWDIPNDAIHCEGNLALFPEGAAQLKNILQESLRTTTDLDSEAVIKDAKNQNRHIALRGKFYRSSEAHPYRATGIAWDITTKRNEENLRRERDLHEAANNAKSILLANASHEIRTPLAAIVGFAETLLRNPSLNEQGRRDAQSIYRQGNFMASLVNDLLDLSKIETNRLYIQKAPMNPMHELEDSISVIRSALEEEKYHLQIAYDTQIPETILSDSVRFRQVLINLLSNAVKFTREGTITVHVAFSTNIDMEGTLTITVSDTGMGMDEATQKNLFQPFVRGESADVQRLQGSGLGLALSERLARMMGGELRLLRSAPGQGSTFEFSLKLGKIQDLKLISPAQTKMQTQGRIKLAKDDGLLKDRHVLVVDDSEDLRALMTRYLKRQDAVVETAENGQEAVTKALAHPYDVILMDIKMPVMDGYKATSQLRERGYRRPIVALTAQASVEGQSRCLANGFDGYLSKPVDMNLLSEILTRVRT